MLRRLYFRLLFALVRRHGYAVVRSFDMERATVAGMECQTFCERSGFLRDNNPNSHKKGKRAEQKIRQHVHDMWLNLHCGLASAFAAEGRRYDW